MLPFDHTYDPKDVTSLERPSNVSHIADALRNSVEKKSYPHLLAVLNLICVLRAARSFGGTLFVNKPSEGRLIRARLQERKRALMAKLIRHDVSDAPREGNFQLEKLRRKASAISRPKWFEVLKLLKNAYQRAHQVPLENIKQRLIHQI